MFHISLNTRKNNLFMILWILTCITILIRIHYEAEDMLRLVMKNATGQKPVIRLTYENMIDTLVDVDQFTIKSYVGTNIKVQNQFLCATDDSPLVYPCVDKLKIVTFHFVDNKHYKNIVTDRNTCLTKMEADPTIKNFIVEHLACNPKNILQNFVIEELSSHGHSDHNHHNTHTEYGSESISSPQKHNIISKVIRSNDPMYTGSGSLYEPPSNENGLDNYLKTGQSQSLFDQAASKHQNVNKPVKRYGA